MIEDIKSGIKKKMDNSLNNLVNELKGIRTGRATPSFLEHVTVEAYGSMMPISQVGSVSAQDAKLLVVQVWDRGLVSSVEKAINISDLGVNASADGQLVRVPIPPLSEERRKELAKLASKYAEQTKIVIRNIRRDAIDEIKKLEKSKDISEDDMRRGSDEVQKITDDFISKIDSALASREKEIMHV